MDNSTVIRNRTSYKMWESIYKMIDDKKVSTQSKIDFIFNLFSKRRLFGSQTAEDYSKESLDLVIKDQIYVKQN